MGVPADLLPAWVGVAVLAAIVVVFVLLGFFTLAALAMEAMHDD